MTLYVISNKQSLRVINFFSPYYTYNPLVFCRRVILL
jgi:hypothetical protein